MALWAARQRVSKSSPEVRSQPLMQLAAKLNHALAELDADLRAGGFGQNCRGLARELYTSLTATIVATRGTEAEAKAWSIGHALAIDLYRSGTRRGALALLEGLIELAAGQCHPEILARLTNAAQAIDQRMGRRRRAGGRTDKVADGPSAASILPVQRPPAQDAGGEVAVPAHESERSTPILVPPPGLLAPRRRSRRGGVIIAAAATTLVGIALYVLVTHDGNLIRHSLSTPTSAATSPSDASLANASRSNAPRATVPMAIGSPDKATTGALAMGIADDTAADATERSPPQGPGQFLLPDEVRYAKARTDQRKAHATLTSRAPKADTPLLDLKTHDGAAAVQTKLRALGYYHHTVDGIWGPMSAAALSTFRQEKGLSSGGVWDLAAQSALLGK
jgi:Putative peptidoglycan binding domain